MYIETSLFVKLLQRIDKIDSLENNYAKSLGSEAKGHLHMKLFLCIIFMILLPMYLKLGLLIFYFRHLSTVMCLCCYILPKRKVTKPMRSFKRRIMESPTR